METKIRNPIVYPSKAEISVEIAKYTAKISAKFCKERGCFTVVLSGGGLIDWLCELVKPPYLDSIEWSKWHVFWVDERVCSYEDDDSNYKLAKEGFLSKVPIPEKNIYAIDELGAKEGKAEECAEHYQDCLQRLVDEKIIPKCPKTKLPQFDLQLLGMGPDGHMASLFPGHPQVNVTDKLVTFITDSPKPPPKRITFTLPVINSASYNLMAVCDDNDPRTPDTIAEIFDNGNKKLLPAGLLASQIETVWFIDQVAASKLKNRTN